LAFGCLLLYLSTFSHILLGLTSLLGLSLSSLLGLSGSGAILGLLPNSLLGLGALLGLSPSSFLFFFPRYGGADVRLRRRSAHAALRRRNKTRRL